MRKAKEIEATAITDLCELLSEQNYDVICPNLLEQKVPYEYSEEEKAYRNFFDNIGILHALHKVKNILFEFRDDYSKIFIVGFSVGATVAWLCSEHEYVDGVVGYYGSRIRDYVHIGPKCPILLFFPIEEKSFNVNELIVSLDKPYVSVHKCKGEHGFSDPYSLKYDDRVTQNTLRKVFNFIEST